MCQGSGVYSCTYRYIIFLFQFVHRGSSSAKLERTCDTSTGSMMNAQFVEPGKPAPPPEPFRAKTMVYIF